MSCLSQTDVLSFLKQTSSRGGTSWKHIYLYPANSIASNVTVKIHVFLRRGFWIRECTYLNFILRYRVRSHFRTVTESFNALRFDWCCSQVWSSKTACFWRSELEAHNTTRAKFLTTYYDHLDSPVIFASFFLS